MKKSVALLSLAVAVKLVSQGALAKVSEEEAARLGNELTCTGAERAANADGSIPAFTGKYLGEVPGWDHVKHSGGKPVDPYPNEKPILVITAQNVEEHAKHLTEGQKAMFRKYRIPSAWTSTRDIAITATRITCASGPSGTR